MAADGMTCRRSGTNEVLVGEPCGGYQPDRIGHDGQSNDGLLNGIRRAEAGTWPGAR
jgi:hypothetical protein